MLSHWAKPGLPEIVVVRSNTTWEPLSAVQACPVVAGARVLGKKPKKGLHFPWGGTLKLLPTIWNVAAVMQKSFAWAVDQLSVSASKVRAGTRTPVFMIRPSFICGGTLSGMRLAECVQLACDRGA